MKPKKSLIFFITATPGLSFLSNQQIYKRVLEWFEIWRPWQQRMLLCGITNRYAEIYEEIHPVTRGHPTFYECVIHTTLA